MARRPGIFGPSSGWPAQDLIAFSAEFDESLVLAAYVEGVFPMPLHASGFGQMGWWSPMQRGVLPLDALRVTRSLRKSAKHYRTTVDRAFGEVIERCADPSRPYGWIDDEVRRVYTSLHRAGVVHSVETWDSDGRLVGGLYGVSLGGLFAGESMFHDPEHGRDASKVALLALVDLLSDEHAEDRIIDVQWQTDHLAGLGVIEIERDEYLGLLAEALAVPDPAWPPPKEDHAGAP
jgi:leucyl/phenylalanyl-tRNA--protein transferase